MRLTFFLFLIVILGGCNNTPAEKQPASSVTVSIRPQKYLINKIAGDKFQVSVLVPEGSGPETYEPTARQMQEISGSSLCFITGLLDFEKTWFSEVSELYPELTVVNLSQGVNVISGDEHDHHGHEAHEGHNHSGLDPHIWLSIRELKTQAAAVKDALVAIDAANKDYYTANFNRFIAYADSADSVITAKFKAAPQPVVYMIYHPSLSYFARDYNLEQLPIELEGKEPGAAWMKELIDMAKTKNIRGVYYSPQLDKRSPQAIASQLGIEARQFNDLGEDIIGNLLKFTDELTAQ